MCRISGWRGGGRVSGPRDPPKSRPVVVIGNAFFINVFDQTANVCYCVEGGIKTKFIIILQNNACSFLGFILYNMLFILFFTRYE